jgi:hypothetical protein
MAWLKQKTAEQVARKKSKKFHRRDAEDAKKNSKSASGTSSDMMPRLYGLVCLALVLQCLTADTDVACPYCICSSLRPLRLCG